MECCYSSKLEKLKILISHFVGNASCMTQEELIRRKETSGSTGCRQSACESNSAGNVDFLPLLSGFFPPIASCPFWDLRGHSAFHNDTEGKTMFC